MLSRLLTNQLDKGLYQFICQLTKLLRVNIGLLANKPTCEGFTFFYLQIKTAKSTCEHQRRHVRRYTVYQQYTRSEQSMELICQASKKEVRQPKLYLRPYAQMESRKTANLRRSRISTINCTKVNWHKQVSSVW